MAFRYISRCYRFLSIPTRYLISKSAIFFSRYFERGFAYHFLIKVLYQKLFADEVAFFSAFCCCGATDFCRFRQDILFLNQPFFRVDILRGDLVIIFGLRSCIKSYSLMKSPRFGQFGNVSLGLQYDQSLLRFNPPVR